MWGKVIEKGHAPFPTLPSHCMWSMGKRGGKGAWYWGEYGEGAASAGGSMGKRHAVLWGSMGKGSVVLGKIGIVWGESKEREVHCKENTRKGRHSAGGRVGRGHGGRGAWNKGTVGKGCEEGGM